MPVRRGYRRELFRRIDPVYRHWVVRYLRFLKKGITIIPFKVPMPSEQPSTFKGKFLKYIFVTYMRHIIIYIYYLINNIYIFIYLKALMELFVTIWKRI